MHHQINLNQLSTPKDILLSDPIRNITRLSKRNVLLLSTIIIVASTFGIESIHIPYLKLEDQGAINIVGMLGCVLIYLSLTYIFNYIIDMQAWSLAERNKIGDSQLESLSNLSDTASHIYFEYNNNKQLYNDISTSHQEVLKSSLESIRSIIEYAKSQHHHTGRLPEEALKRLEQRIDYFCGGNTYNTSNPTKNPHHFLLSGEYIKFLSNLDYQLKKFLEDSNQHIKLKKTIRKESLQLAFAHYVKLYFWEGIFPITIAFIGIIKSYAYLIDFFHQFLDKF